MKLFNEGVPPEMALRDRGIASECFLCIVFCFVRKSRLLSCSRLKFRSNRCGSWMLDIPVLTLGHRNDVLLDNADGFTSSKIFSVVQHL